MSMTMASTQAGAAVPDTNAASSDAPAWLVSAAGRVQPVGGATYYGDLGAYVLSHPIVAITSTSTGGGYWLLSADGGIFAFGDAGFYGSMGGVSLASPVVALASTKSGKGYWMVAADGGIFAFGDAGFYGSMGGTALNSSIVAMAVTPSGNGYWLVAADGGIFAFGDAGFYGSMGGTVLNRPVVGIASSADGKGYWLVGSDGGIFSFGSTHFFGSTASLGVAVSGLAPTSAGDGYQIFSKDGRIFGFGAGLSNPNRSAIGTVVGVAPGPRKLVAAPPPLPPTKGGEVGVTTTTRATAPVTQAPSAPAPTTTSPAPAAPPVTAAPVVPPVSTTAAPAPKPPVPTTTAPGKTSGGATMSYPSAGSTPNERAYNALGIYKGGSRAANFLRQEQWMGREVDYWLTWLGGSFKSTLQAIGAGVDAEDSRFLRGQRTLILSLDLVERNGHSGSRDATQQLTAAKNGANDWYWRALGRLLVKKGLTGNWPDGRPKVILRIAWEHNGDWYPWSSRPRRNELFKASYRRAVKNLESAAGDVVTVWGSSTLQNTAADLNASYPGDDVVDIIEVDVYDAYGAYLPNKSAKPNVSKREATWERKLNGTSRGLTGLQFFADFARSHKKGFAIGEFGVYSHVKNGSQVGGGDNPAFIKHVFDFAGAQENLVYVNYFETNRPGANGTRHRLSPTGYVGGDGNTAKSQFPKAAAKFLELWGDR
jgi:Glycosyl hydrolase family 26